MAAQISVVVVDDHPLFRAGVIQTLALDDEIQVAGEGGSGAEALTLAREHGPDIVLLDISMPGDGIETARELSRLAKAPRVVMLTVSESDDDIMRALEAGAVGYVLKGIGASDLIGAIKSVAAGESFVSPNLTLRLLTSVKQRTTKGALSALTKQEERTLRLVAMGLSNREVGERLGILEKTVKYHMSNIMEKLKVRNRVEATLIARQVWGELTEEAPT
ncbi:response regulator [Microvirga massiliensis]|uniref:response regulator n=1 Tax=Microvirga massiliensis TaxID=1033741 RepID=UPI00062BD3E3|nr:response regulator transcription factor [Microvirga massiliensis]